MRVKLDPSGSILNPDFFQSYDRLEQSLAMTNFFMNQQRIHDLFGDTKIRIERSHRILEDHQYPFPAYLPELVARAMKQVNPVEAGSSRIDSMRGWCHPSKHGI